MTHIMPFDDIRFQTGFVICVHNDRQAIMNHEFGIV